MAGFLKALFWQLMLIAVSALPLSTNIFAQGNADAGHMQVKKASCAGCHGATGYSFSSSNPRLAGQAEAYLLDAMLAYKNKKRQHGLMVAIMQPYSEQAIEDIAAFYAQQTACQAKQDKLPMSDTLKSTLEGCHFCHNSDNSMNPKLVGQHAAYLLDAMMAYKNKQREHALMASFLAPLERETLKEIAHFYSSQSICE